MITVYVGSAETEYYLYTCKATKTSEFFREERKRGNLIYVPHSRRLFEIYFEWMNNGDPVFPEGVQQTNYEELVNLYGLGKHLRDKTFCNAIIDATIELGVRDAWLTNIPIHGASRYDASGGMERLRIRVYAMSLTREDVLNPDREIDPSWARTLMAEYLSIGGDPTRFRLPTMEDRCEFHIHHEGEPKCT